MEKVKKQKDKWMIRLMIIKILLIKDAMNDDRDFGFMHDYESSHANKKDHITMASIIGYILSFRYSSWNLIYLV